MQDTAKEPFAYEKHHRASHLGLGVISLLMGGFGAYYALDFQNQLHANGEQVRLHFKSIHFVLMLLFTPIILALEYRAHTYQKFLSVAQRKFLIGAAVACLVVPGLISQFVYSAILKQNGYEFCRVIGTERMFSPGTRKSYHIDLYKKYGECEKTLPK